MDITKQFGNLQSQLGGANLDKINTSLANSNTQLSGANLDKLKTALANSDTQFSDANLDSLFGDLQSKVGGTDLDSKFGNLQSLLDDANLEEQFGDLTSQLGAVDLDNLFSDVNLDNADAGLFKDPALNKKFEKGIGKIQNFKGLDNITAKITTGISDLSTQTELTPDALDEVLAGGLDLPDDLSTKFQLSIDKVNKEGGLQEIGNIDPAQLDGLTTQLANFNTGFAADRYTTDVDGLLGKFKMDPSMLQEAGMLQPGLGDKFRQGLLSAGDVVNNPANWKGGTMPGSKLEFLNSPKLQESGFKNGLSGFFNKLQANGGIKPTDLAEQQGALLAVSTKLGPAAASQWRQGFQTLGTDTTLADKLAQNGAYGISVLGAKK